VIVSALSTFGETGQLNHALPVIKTRP